MLLGEGYKFLGTQFWRGQDFWAVNLRGAKTFGPSLLKYTGPLPPIVNDRSLTLHKMCYISPVRRHGPIYGRFMGSTVNGFLSVLLCKV